MRGRGGDGVTPFLYGAVDRHFDVEILAGQVGKGEFAAIGRREAESPHARGDLDNLSDSQSAGPSAVLSGRRRDGDRGTDGAENFEVVACSQTERRFLRDQPGVDRQAV